MPKIGNTKEILADSLCNLAETKPVNDITVLDIVSNCGLTAPTFYNHFRNKYDLIVWYYTRLWSSVLDKTGKEGYVWRDAVHDGLRM
ncbi:TetR family transcriptional regulator [Methanomassiliicoccales archaeon LGM-RCC1]|nr:TetR family transcriptional regulator [Methanomassiliicoccales archaeon LGM-RCC1]